MTTFLVTGGAGFIGSNLVHMLMKQANAKVVVLDALTYAGNPDNLAAFDGNDRFTFVHGDLCDRELLDKMLTEHRPQVVFNLAAETHVDRSISGPEQFVQSNVVGTFQLLDATRVYWSAMSGWERMSFRVVHVSTDEVYGSVEDGVTTEESPYEPNTPYAASKASSDHMTRAYFQTYGLPVLTTNCSNNFGPYQYPEKLVPIVTMNALKGEPLPVHGSGQHVRDWLYVTDHCEALMRVAALGRPGETYNVSAGERRTVLQVVDKVCEILTELQGQPRVPYRELVEFVDDRPGNDLRYAMDSERLKSRLRWQPRTPFDHGMRQTIQWYINNQAWCERIAERAMTGG